MPFLPVSLPSSKLCILWRCLPYPSSFSLSWISKSSQHLNPRINISSPTKTSPKFSRPSSWYLTPRIPPGSPEDLRWSICYEVFSTLYLPEGSGWILVDLICLAPSTSFAFWCPIEVSLVITGFFCFFNATYSFCHELILHCCCLVALCYPKNCSMPGLPVPHHHPKFAQVQVHWVSDAIQPSQPLPPSNSMLLINYFSGPQFPPFKNE